MKFGDCFGFWHAGKFISQHFISYICTSEKSCGGIRSEKEGRCKIIGKMYCDSIACGRGSCIYIGGRHGGVWERE